MANERFQSTKLIDGFSTCFRQWKAEDTHCKYLHGYSISFKVIFEGSLDYRNWVADFGFMKRSKTRMDYNDVRGFVYSLSSLQPEAWFKNIFDHTVVLAQDDPLLDQFQALQDSRAIVLRVLPLVGCEMFAKFVYDELNKFLYKETEDRVRVVSVECFEHAKNSAIYTNQ